MEEEISKQLNVSRTPVRTALTALEKEGLVRIIPRKGAYVVSLDIEDIEEIYVLREVLEATAARYSAKYADNSFIDKLEEALNDYKASVESKDYNSCIKYDEVFHNLIHNASRNSRLISHLEILKNQIQLLKFRSSHIPGRPLKSLSEHIEILNAIKERDPDRSELAMKTHIKNAKRMS